MFYSKNVLSKMKSHINVKITVLVTDSNLLKSLLVVFGFGSQAFVCEFNRQNICSVIYYIFGYQKMMKVRLNIQLMTFIGYSVFGPIWNSNFTNKLFPEKK